MRFALSSLIVAAGLAGAAYAQTPAPAAPAAAPTAAPPAAAPATPAPAAAGTTGATAAPPAAGGSVPTLPGADQAPPPAPTLPTTGDGAEALQVLEKVCVPSVKGTGKFDDIAKAAGFKMNRRDMTWTKQLGTTSRDYQIIIYPPGSNKNVCNAELHFAQGQDAEILKALNVWAFVHQPPLDPTANYTQPQDPDGMKRVRRSWEYLNHDNATNTNTSIGLNFSTVRKPDDSLVNPKFDQATMQYQERTF